MDRTLIEQTIVSQCKNNISKDEVKDLLKKSSIRVQDYNKTILEILKNIPEKDYHPLKVESLIDNSIIKDLIEEKSRINKDFSLFSIQIQQNLENFYKIENCPSFLYNNAILADEDYEAFIEIYSRLYGLENNAGKEAAIYIRDYMKKYIKKLFESCDNEITLDSLKALIEK